MDRTITFRPIGPADGKFLYDVYASTRTEELSIVPWSEPEKATFLRMQFDAQHRYYQEQFATAAYDIILVDAQPAGRLYVDRLPDEIRIIDIALLPAFRNAGIGSKILRDLLAEGDYTGKPVAIHVEKMNPALRLYQRLGFQ